MALKIIISIIIQWYIETNIQIRQVILNYRTIAKLISRFNVTMEYTFITTKT